MAATAKEHSVNWGSLNEFLAMGGYGLYVWGSYGMVALCIVIEIFSLNMSQEKT